MPSARPHELWLWMQFVPAHFDRLVDECRVFPRVDEVSVTAFDDASSTAGLIRLRFWGTDSERVDVCLWARLAGFELIDTSDWSPEKLWSFEREVDRFRCGIDDAVDGVYALSCEIARASMTAVSDGVPMFIVRSDDTLKRHLVAGAFA